jgi:hypothetical protein
VETGEWSAEGIGERREGKEFLPSALQSAQKLFPQTGYIISHVIFSGIGTAENLAGARPGPPLPRGVAPREAAPPLGSEGAGGITPGGRRLGTRSNRTERSRTPGILGESAGGASPVPASKIPATGPGNSGAEVREVKADSEVVERDRLNVTLRRGLAGPGPGPGPPDSKVTAEGRSRFFSVECCNGELDPELSTEPPAPLSLRTPSGFKFSG